MSHDGSFPSLVQLQFRRAKTICKRGTTTHLKTGSTKSFAQVETLVIPPVLPKSCELKLGGSTRKKRPGPYSIRITEDQKAFVQAKAKAAGLSVNEYIRTSVLGSNYTPPLPKELCGKLLDLNRELTRQGNNLNQIARQLNAGILSPAEAEMQLADLAPTMIETHKAIREALAQGRVES